MGDWSKEGIPHKGWNCIDVFDLADETAPGEEIEYEQCEMCGNERIRYVHVMKHPEFSEELHVGCVCAEKMSNDYVNPRKSETSLRNKAVRKRNFNKVEWRYNPVKNTYSKRYKGEFITIMESQYGSWGIFFAGQKSWKIDGKRIGSMEEAENLAFEIFEEYHTTQEEREMQFYLNQRRNF